MSDDFLSRWSRRKRRPEAVEEPPPPAAPPAAEAEGSDEEILARLGMKHPEEMDADDDFAAFLNAAVPKHLKTMALRRLWRSNPTLACLDGLNDYDTDFTGTGVPPGGLKTSYEVGRGILKRIAEVADAPAEPAAPEADAEAMDTAGAQVAESAAEVAAPGPAKPVEQEPVHRATRRRMVFRSGTMSHHG